MPRGIESSLSSSLAAFASRNPCLHVAGLLLVWPKGCPKLLEATAAQGYLVGMELGVPWNTMECSGVQWNTMEYNGIQWNTMD